MIDKYPIPEFCPYCGGEVILTNKAYRFEVVYGHGKIYACTVCDAYVGCHGDRNNTPMGRLSDANLRYLKKRAHLLFDPLWRTGFMDRNVAYSLLARQMGLSRNECHFGWFDERQVKQAIHILENIHNCSYSANARGSGGKKKSKKKKRYVNKRNKSAKGNKNKYKG